MTQSSKDVVRGMHYQETPYQLSKLVSCIKGKIIDVIVAVDPANPFYNQPFSITLSENDNIALLIPKGYAHGFLGTDSSNLVQYFTDTKYVPTSDTGVLWSSINFQWPVEDPIISDRDSKFGPI